VAGSRRPETTADWVVSENLQILAGRVGSGRCSSGKENSDQRATVVASECEYYSVQRVHLISMTTSQEILHCVSKCCKPKYESTKIDTCVKTEQVQALQP